MRRIAVAEYQRIPVLDVPSATARAMAATGAVRVHGPYGATTLVEARSTIAAIQILPDRGSYPRSSLDSRPSNQTSCADLLLMLADSADTSRQ